MKPGARWILLVVGLLVFSLLTHGVLIAAAVIDPGFALPADFERAAGDWDAVVAERHASAALGWTMRLTTRPETPDVRIELVLLDRDERPVTDAAVTVDTFFIARAARRLTATPVEVEPGRYSTLLPMRRSGQWELNVQAVRGEERFIERRRLHILTPPPAAGSPTP
ncbi:MAG: hypothetical protein HKO59_11750 [Phycisphaerales bacterium]|nr:FixH family protein [Phycisphaerae bacterium]NNF41532.1 hypothetical protein [Phycisphaerales bacterium]NNM26637.1 hypothetical protein [Phycisphaerales bacterium]